MLGLTRGTVCLCNYDKNWNKIALETIKNLKTIFGDIACDIQHIGSTSIKNIKSKPIIDIAIGVKIFDNLSEALLQMDSSGIYSRSHNHFSNDLLYIINDVENKVTHHIHILIFNSPQWGNYIHFRDYMNAFPNKVKEYEQLKITLAKKHKNSRTEYTDGKKIYMQYTLRKALVWSYLGKTIDIIIDRPIGYVHKKEKYTLTYPINYGYIPNVIGGDGEELDVYVLGIDKPLDKFTGKVIGIVNRINDVEDKLIVAPENINFNQAEIATAIYFQEQYYKITIDSIYQKSCGAIVFRKRGNRNEYLLLLQKQTHSWSFPKGHMEAGETEIDTAKREIYEEVGLKLDFIPKFRKTIKYSITDTITKEVVLFLAENESKPNICHDEIDEYCWATADEAKEKLHKQYSKIIDIIENS